MLTLMFAMRTSENSKLCAKRRVFDQPACAPLIAGTTDLAFLCLLYYIMIFLFSDVGWGTYFIFI